VKSLKVRLVAADMAKAMGASAVTTTPLRPQPRGETPRVRRTGFRLSILGLLLTLVGALAVLALGDGSGGPDAVRGNKGPSLPATGAGTTEAGTTEAGATRADATTATAVPATPAAGGAQGTVGAGAPNAAAPATPEQVAALLAGLPLQLERAATVDGGQPRELPPEEVDRIVDDILRQLGAKP
jgi:hypothetical protein